MEGSYAFIADGQMGLVTVDISDPEGILPISGWCDTQGYAKDVTVSAGMAYVADGYSGVAVIDVSDPRSPEFVKEHDTSGYSSRITHYDNVLMVADRSGGLLIFDISNLNDPVPIGTIDFSYADGLAVADGTVFVADKYKGLCIITEE